MTTHRRLLAAAAATAAAALLAFAAPPAQANHGPGTSGGGTYTIAGETLAQGKWDLSLRGDYTNFQEVSQAGAERRAARHGSYDAIQESYLLTAGAAYGVTDDLQVGLTLGYYKANGFIDAERTGGQVESSTADPDGLTDLALTVKYRLIAGKPGNLSVVGGILFPTGRDDARLSGGETLEPSSQPGTGAWGFQIGLAYSRYLTPRITLDASILYTSRERDDDFKVGDRFDLGVAVNYRLTESVQKFPNWSVFGEINTVHLEKDNSFGDDNGNSGGWTTSITPGVRCRINERWSVTVAPSFPIIQELNGAQPESRFKLAAMASYSF